MPTIFAHGAIGYTAARVFDPYHDRVVIASILLAALPDIDGLFFRLIPYRHPLGHRGLTHSLLFAVTVGCFVAMLFVHKRWNLGLSMGRLAVFFSCVMASHGFFDAMTDGGAGVAFFAPFDNRRYFFPFRPIPVSPMTLEGLLSKRGQAVIRAELGFFGLFALAAALWSRWSRWRRIAAMLCAAAGVVVWLTAIRR